MIDNLADRFTDKSQMSAMKAMFVAKRNRHSIIDLPHLLFALLEFPEDILAQVIQLLEIDVKGLKKRIYKVIKLQEKVPFWTRRDWKMFVTPNVKKSIETAISLSEKRGDEKASSMHLLYGVVDSTINYPRTEIQLELYLLLRDANISPSILISALDEVDQDKDEIDLVKKE